ncbi:MAG: hypothetical protein JO092_07155 [Candidatus Eremiobacteraeota bacterium]|nr:hypothetical protein [Candidatus Eremiobacteraeota bacterium]
MKRNLFALLVALITVAASPLQLDSQYVLQRYMLAIDTVVQPKAVIFTYTVSQAGPSTIEQRHVIFRNGADVRDETLAVDGVPLVRKLVRFSHREDSYAIVRLAPRTTEYELLFVGTLKDGRHVDYLYDATPLIRTASALIDRVTIDGVRYLPRTVYFTTQGPEAKGSARVQYAAFGKYWMPVAADVDAVVRGKPARERITWSDYSFPQSLPASAFAPPKPLPGSTLPPI